MLYSLIYLLYFPVRYTYFPKLLKRKIPHSSMRHSVFLSISDTTEGIHVCRLAAHPTYTFT
jgi:hypothetical protein